jgi:hypothetical protein
VKEIVMARSHHRKKHKEHLRHYQHTQESVVQKQKGKAANVFAVVGAVAGLAIGYFASDRSVAWSIVGMLAGAAAGYFLGRNIDRQGNKRV